MIDRDERIKIEKIQKVKGLQDVVKQKGLDGLVEHFKKDPSVPFDYELREGDWLSILTADEKVSATLEGAMAMNRAFEEKKKEYKERLHMASHAINTVNRMEAFLADEAREDMALSAEDLRNFFRRRPAPQFNPKEVKEKDGSEMEFVEDEFENWDKGVHHTPRYTFVPKTVEGIQNLVKWATRHNLKIRASGYRHSSSEMFSEEGHISISMINLRTATRLPLLPGDYPPRDPSRDLHKIDFVGDAFKENGKYKRLCRIGAGVCNYQFQDWVHSEKPGEGNKQWCLPMNVVMTEITIGGSNAPICHGAGVNNKTLSDLVTEIEFVNCKGELQTVNDEHQIKAAAGCFGMLGIVTAVTLKLDKMTYANMGNTVERKPLVAAIPPPRGYQIPHEINRGNVDETAARDNFFRQCANDYFTEWFWFPLQEECWVNCWQNDGKPERAVRFPGESEIEWERFTSSLAHLANLTVFKLLFAEWHTKIMGTLGLNALPHRPNVVCTLEDAEHYRHGIQNVRAKMIEFQIPIPNNAAGEPDWTICQRAWWDAITLVYEEARKGNFPMRLAVEMRVMGGSDVLMAPQYNNDRTCSIEVVTPQMISEEIWVPFVQKVLDKWSSYRDVNGKPLNIRPHWAKRHDGHLHNGLKINGVPMDDYLKQAYALQTPLFFTQLRAICESKGYTLQDIAKTFSNPYLRKLFADMGYTEVLRPAVVPPAAAMAAVAAATAVAAMTVASGPGMLAAPTERRSREGVAVEEGPAASVLLRGNSQ